MRKTPTQVLDASIGGFTTMRLEYLKNASREGGSSIPWKWKSNDCYEQLAAEGLVSEVPVGNPFVRCWKITESGAALLANKSGEVKENVR